MKTKNTINVRIRTINEKSQFVDTFIPVTLGDHRVRFSSAHQNTIDLKIEGNFPRKAFLNYLYNKCVPSGEIVQSAAVLRLVVKRSETLLHFIVKYTVKTQTAKGKYILEEREQVFLTDADRETVIHYGDRFIVNLYGASGCNPSTVKMFIESYNNFAHPITLESVTEKLTEDQKMQAAKMLKAFFAA